MIFFSWCMCAGFITIVTGSLFAISCKYSTQEKPWLTDSHEKSWTEQTYGSSSTECVCVCVCGNMAAI